jgi:hypothetical protein
MAVLTRSRAKLFFATLDPMIALMLVPKEKLLTNNMLHTNPTNTPGDGVEPAHR